MTSARAESTRRRLVNDAPLREKQRESLRDLVDRDTLVVLAPRSGKTAIRSAVQRATAARSLAEK